MDEVYGACEECAGCFMVGVLYPVPLGQGGEGEVAYVVACDCLEYDTDGCAADALADRLGGNFRSGTSGEGAVLLDDRGVPVTVVRALEVLAAATDARGGLVETIGSSSSSSSSSSS